MYVIVMPVSDVSVCEIKWVYKRNGEEIKKEYQELSFLLTKQWCSKPFIVLGVHFGGRVVPLIQH